MIYVIEKMMDSHWKFMAFTSHFPIKTIMKLAKKHVVFVQTIIFPLKAIMFD